MLCDHDRFAGANVIGCYGRVELRTPNIDALLVLCLLRTN